MGNLCLLQLCSISKGWSSSTPHASTHLIDTLINTIAYTSIILKNESLGCQIILLNKEEMHLKVFTKEVISVMRARWSPTVVIINKLVGSQPMTKS